MNTAALSRRYPVVVTGARIIHPRRAAVVWLAIVLTAASASAHVTVQPRRSEAGAIQRYMVRVPTEGQVPTESVELDVPADVEVIDVPPGADYVSETRREAGRIVAIRWIRHIPPGSAGEFGFVARKPPLDSHHVEGPAAIRRRHQRRVDGAGPRPETSLGNRADAGFQVAVKRQVRGSRGIRSRGPAAPGRDLQER